MLKARHGRHSNSARYYALQVARNPPTRAMAGYEQGALTPAFKQAMAMQAIVRLILSMPTSAALFLHTPKPQTCTRLNWRDYLPGAQRFIWENQIDFADMQITNPSSGFILSTNQDPFKVTATGQS